MRRGYHGGDFDGGNWKKLLECAQNLVEPVEGTFGENLDLDYETLITNYGEKFAATQDYVESLNAEVHLRVSWKVHVIVCHLAENSYQVWDGSLF